MRSFHSVGRKMPKRYDEFSDDCTSILTAHSSGSPVAFCGNSGLVSNDEPPSSIGVAYTTEADGVAPASAKMEEMASTLQLVAATAEAL